MPPARDMTLALEKSGLSTLQVLPMHSPNHKHWSDSMKTAIFCLPFFTLTQPLCLARGDGVSEEDTEVQSGKVTCLRQHNQ